MWLIPSYNRPEMLRRLLNSIAEVEPSTGPIVVKYDPKDTATADLLLQEGGGRWSLWDTPNVGCSLALQWAYHLWPAEPFYGFIGDDTEITSESFFPLMEEAAGPNRIAVPNDLCWPGAKVPEITPLPRHCCIGGELVRAWGFWAVPGLYHCFCDVFWHRFMKEFPSSWKGVPGAVLRHYHHLDAPVYPADRRTKELFPRDSTHELGETYMEYDKRIIDKWFDNHWPIMQARLAAYKGWEEKL